MNKKPAIGALDFGASGARLYVATMDDLQIDIEELHRFTYSPSRYWQTSLKYGAMTKRLCWSFDSMYRGLIEGLSRIAGRTDLQLVSFGIDTWGSDGVWVNDSGDMLGLIGTGRDPRWVQARDEVIAELGEEELFRQTGVRSDPFCVLNQLYWYVTKQPKLVGTAATYMPINSLFHYLLCGQRVAEYTWMSTTQLASLTSIQYNEALFTRLNLPLEKMPPLVQPGTRLGKCHGELSASLGLAPFEIIAPATHDTASAYAAAPVRSNRKAVLISSGTWSLIGIPCREPIVSNEAFEAGLSNIAGCENTYFQAIITGSWPAQELQRLWSKEDGKQLTWEAFGELASSAPPGQIALDIDDSVFYAPDNMEDAIVQFCQKTNQSLPADRADAARAVYEGLALRTAMACERMQEISGYDADEIIIVSGGTRNDLLNQWIADASGLPVRTGSANATGLGNILVQAKALGWVNSLAEGRELIRKAVAEKAYEPVVGERWQEGKAKLRGYRHESSC